MNSSDESNSSYSSVDKRRKKKKSKRENKVLWKEIDKLKRKLKKRRRSRSRDSSYGEEDRKRRRKDHRYFSRSSVTSDRDNGELARRSSPRCSQNSQNSQSRSRSREGSHLENKSFSEKDRESVEYRPREMPRSSQVSKSDKGTNNELKDSILALLGEDPAKNTCVGPQIHRAIADRWTDILQNGLPKDKKEEILKKYSPAENCSMLQAPKLGPHVQSTMSTISIKRDAYQMLAQNQLGKGISVLGTVLTEMVNLKDEKEDQGQIALFSDAARILTDLYHTMSTSRKYFIMSGFNSAEKAIANESKIDEFLFGKDFSEKVKAFQSVERSTKKYPSQSSTTSRPKTVTGHLNYQGPSRRTPFNRNQRGGGMDRGKSNYRQYNNRPMRR